MKITHKPEIEKKREFTGVTIEVETLEELEHMRLAMGQYNSGLSVYGSIKAAYEKYC